MRHVGTWKRPAAVLAAWLIVGLLAVPPLLTVLYDSGSLSRFASESLSFYLAQWRSMVYVGAIAAVAVYLFLRRLRDPHSGFVPEARPSDLGAIRILVGSVLLVSALWEDVASTAYIPRAVMEPLGIMQIVALLPGYSTFAASPLALLVFDRLTIVVLALGIVGWHTRRTVPLGAAMYLVLGGVMRQYAWFYHTGLLAVYLYVILAFLPCGHGLSMDRHLRRRQGRSVTPDIPSPRFGWARYAVWVTLAVPYVAAGLSKLRNGGLFWWGADNFKFILFQSTLRPMEFDFNVSLGLAEAPDWLFAALGLSAVLGELLYGTVLFSRWARRILPITMLLMHVGILFLQNILFFDLICLQLIYLNFRPLLKRVSGELPFLGRIGSGAGMLTTFAEAPTLAGASPAAGRRLTRVVVIVLAVCWVFRIEFYPLTGMQMFSGRRSEPVVYELAFAHLRTGKVVRAPIEESIGGMSDGRYRRLLQRAFDPARADVTQAFMASVTDRWNDRVGGTEEIERIEIQQWEWYYLAEPGDPNHGSLVDRVVYEVKAPDR